MNVINKIKLSNENEIVYNFSQTGLALVFSMNFN